MKVTECQNVKVSNGVHRGLLQSFLFTFYKAKSYKAFVQLDYLYVQNLSDITSNSYIETSAL